VAPTHVDLLPADSNTRSVGVHNKSGHALGAGGGVRSGEDELSVSGFLLGDGSLSTYKPVGVSRVGAIKTVSWASNSVMGETTYIL
jgi:hypothetical protein